MNFKTFLLVEQRDYLSQRIGDILTGVHELLVGGKQVGERQLLKRTEDIVTQIRRVLHSSWPRSEYKFLRRLQKCGIALMRSIDEKGDLRDTLNSVRHELEQLSQKLGMPVNNLAAPKSQQAPQAPQPPQPPQQQAPQPQQPPEPPNAPQLPTA